MTRRGILGAAWVLASGCGIPVKVGTLDEAGGTTDVDSESGSSTSGTPEVTSTESSTTEDSDTGVIEVREFAIRHGDIPETGTGESGDGGSGASGSESGSDVDPDSLLVVVTTGEAICDDPFGGVPCPERWKVDLTLPPELQVAGATGSLFADVNGFFFESGAFNGPGPEDCGGGGGSLDGTFEVLAIDDASVTMRLTNLQHFSDIIPLELEFTAPRCS